MPSHKQPTIRFKLTCLVAACVLPLWLIAGLLVLHSYSAMCDQVKSNMRENAQMLDMAVDRELTAVQAALVAFATSPHFAQGNFEGLHREARELLAFYPGADIIIADATGQQVVNSFRPYGSKLPKRNNPLTVRRIFEEGKPIVSDLYYGAVTKRPMISVDVPVLIGGKIAYDLAMTFPSDRVAAVLSRDKLPPEWSGAILDSKGIVAASTLDPAHRVGKPTSAAVRRALGNRSEGTTEVTSGKGDAHFVAFSRSTVSSWAVAIEVPEESVLAETYRWLVWALACAGAISLAGILLALRIGRTIAHDIQNLVHPALAIGRGEAATDAGHHTVKETAEVASALAQASALLQYHARERDTAEMQLSLTIDDLRKETAQRLKAMEELRAKDRILIQQSRQAAMGEMIGNIAHQWRQPLNALALSVQQVQLYHELGILDQQFIEENFTTSMRLIEHMSRTIDDFRNYFKPDIEMEDFSIHDAVTKTLTLLEGSLRNQRIDVRVDAKAQPVIHGYPNEFAQVLLNILTNAKDALAERTVEAPRIEVAIDKVREKSVVTVTDNAGGVPEEIMDKIFDPYFTTKGPQAGTGVGLFMSKSIIEKKMAGRLLVRNVDGGAQFTIEL